jgi:hypothetical protein
LWCVWVDGIFHWDGASQAHSNNRKRYPRLRIWSGNKSQMIFAGLFFLFDWWTG